MATATSPAPYLDVRHVVKTFGAFTALNDVSFTAQRGEFLSILGPSGCGKTTMLRAVAGLDVQDSGAILFDGTDVSHLPIAKRNVGIVFQSYALFPNLTANDNIAYGLKNQGKDKKAVKARVAELVELVGLKEFCTKYPAQLSGGQQQRVALARAMALSPSLLLLDEPLSALDAKVRIKLRAEIRDLAKRLNVTTIMVTHDQEEALTMADRILVMNNGVLAQFGTPQQIYEWPNSPFVASFIGSMNFLPGAVKADTERYSVGGLHLRVDHEGNGLKPGAKAMVAIRPEDVGFVHADGSTSNNSEVGAADGGSENVIPAAVRWLEFRGAMFRVGLEVKEHGEAAALEADLATEQARGLGLEQGKQVNITLPASRIRVYPAS